jgi:anaerobic ribonucleoside-triphosphate reductase
MNCPKCGDELWYANVANDNDNSVREMVVCRNEDCGFKAQKTLVYARVCGYMQPVAQWNKGKQQEFNERVTYAIEK